MNAIQEKIDKANEVIEKKHNLIKKRYAAIEKKLTQLNKLGLFEFEYVEDCKSLKQQCIDAEQAYRDQFKGGSVDEDSAWHDLYWGKCDVEDYIESIENAYKAIEEKKATIERYKVQLAKSEEKELEFEALPDVIKRFASDVAEAWDSWDAFRQASVIEARNECDTLYNEMYEARREMGYEGAKEKVKVLQAVIDEIHSKYSHKECDALPYMSKDAIHEENVKESKVLALDLAYRVEKIVGNIVDASDLRLSRGNTGCVVINGLVKGESKVAKVQSVGAGGWNIQRFHIRTLVNEVKAND